MDGQMVFFIIALIVLACIIMYQMFNGGRYKGEWIIHGATGEKLCVYRTAADARSDGKETLQFHLRWEENSEHVITQGNDCITIVPTHWITRMDKVMDKAIEKQKK